MTIPKSIHVGFLNIHLYGVVIASAILLAWWLAVKRAHLYNIPRQKFESVSLLIPLVLGIVGGRLYHVIDKWGYYTLNPAQIIRVDQGGLGIWGALLGIFLGFYIFARIQKINLLSLLDLIAPSLLLAQGIGRIGNYINQEGFGPPTNLPWGVYIDLQNRPAQFILSKHFHPTFFYEMWLDFIFAAVLIYLAPKFKKPGQLVGLYLISYGAIRFFVEFFRIDTWRIDNFHVALFFSVLSILIGCFLLFGVKKIIDINKTNT
jgi:phosphatidylglycerol:prolipoprotein diacylglycerol transferase